MREIRLSGSEGGGPKPIASPYPYLTYFIPDGEPAKNAGGKNEGIFHYVIENKCIKNVRNGPFHYVIEKSATY
jgi:hypothetical protein